MGPCRAQEGVGRVTPAADILRMMREHDLSHREEIAALRRTDT